MAAAEATLAAGLAAGTTYFNIHTQMFPGGEIRGFLVPAAIPEPSTVGLISAGLVGILVLRGRLKNGTAGPAPIEQVAGDGRPDA